MGKTELLGVPEIREYIVDYWFDLLLLDTHKDAEVMPQHKDPIGSLSIDIPKEGSRWASTREDRSSAWATIGNGKPLPEFPLVPHIRPQPSNQIKFQFGKIENPPETGDLWGAWRDNRDKIFGNIVMVSCTEQQAQKIPLGNSVTLANYKGRSIPEYRQGNRALRHIPTARFESCDALETIDIFAPFSHCSEEWKEIGMALTDCLSLRSLPEDTFSNPDKNQRYLISINNSPLEKLPPPCPHRESQFNRWIVLAAVGKTPIQPQYSSPVPKDLQARLILRHGWNVLKLIDCPVRRVPPHTASFRFAEAKNSLYRSVSKYMPLSSPSSHASTSPSASRPLIW